MTSVSNASSSSSSTASSSPGNDLSNGSSNKPGNNNSQAGTSADGSKQSSQPDTIASPLTSSSSSDNLKNTASTEDKLKEGGTPALEKLTPLTGPASMAARREFVGAPLQPGKAYEAYKAMNADSFAGPDDMRLKQLENAVTNSNDAFKAQVKSADVAGANTYGRAKGSFSTFSKISSYDKTIGQLDDLSAARIDVDVTKPGMADVYDAQSKAGQAIGDDLTLNKDFIKKPTGSGYSGRLHSNLVEANGLTHELQVGTKDLSSFIDHSLTTKAGDKISVHDALYKSEIYGTNVDKPLQKEYSRLMKEITRTNKAGQEIADVAAVEQRVAKFYADVESALPDSLNKPPAPTLSTRARIGNGVGKGFGVLGIAGGGLQTYNGVNTLSNGGDKIEGVADVGAGTTSVVSGVALMSGRVALGTGSGGAVAVIDGAKDIYIGVRDGNIEKTAVGTIKTGAGTAMLAGVATANPVLIAGGAIAYGGAVVYESRDAIASAAKSTWNWATSWL